MRASFRNMMLMPVVACVLAIFECGSLARPQEPVSSPSSNAAPLPANGRILHVTAFDDKGQPFTGLTAGDLRVFEDGRPRPIATFHELFGRGNHKALPPRTLVLFDLLNGAAGQRENSSTLIVQALQPVETGDLVYLYLITNCGDLYNVHDLYKPPPPAAPTPGGGRPPADPPWTQQVRPLLDQAILNVNAFRLKDYQDEGVRSAATFMALDQLGAAFMRVPGPKTIVWITQGVPNALDYRYGCKDVTFPEGSGSYLAGRCGNDCTRRPGVSKCVDYSPFLQHFAAKLMATDTIMYSAELHTSGAIPVADRGRPRDTLQQLADLSGGRLYLNGEIDQAIYQALQNSRSRYQLLYDAPAPDGKYHKIRVECSRPRVHVEFPQGYFASPQ
jgi:VWFA-related protein